jgi:predicted membrane chloride channel (bestrophin family)
MRLRQIFDYLATQQKLEKEVQKALVQTTFKLNETLMITERLRNSPIPPLYTAHTTRLLIFYLFWLPLALYGTLRNSFATLLVTAAVGYAMLGLDEISHMMELPYRLMPLMQLSKMSMIDSADAIVYRPPPLDGEFNTEPAYSTPEYW